jgi:hypothetical protein
MPNQAKHPLLAARVPVGVAEEFRRIAKVEGMRTGEMLAEMLSKFAARWRKARAARPRARRLGRRAAVDIT